ncbi:MAG: hypothetical protein ACTHZ9_12380 [Leucobacter sp.]
MSDAVKPIHVSALGSVVGLVFAEDAPIELVRRIRSAWSGAEVEDQQRDRVIQIAPVPDAERQMEALSVGVTEVALGHRGGELVLFHAAGVANDQGRVAAFIGASGSGKSTLSRELGQHYAYVSDEAVGVDSTSRVFPHRKPLSVVRQGAPKEQVSPAAAGLLDLPDAELHLGAIVIMDREEAVIEPVIENVTFTSAIDLLVPQLSYFSDLPSPLQTLATLCDEVGGLVRLRYSDASDVKELVPRLLSRRPQEQSWQPSLHSVNGEFSTDAVSDAISVDDRVVVLVDGNVQVLDGIAPAIWDAARLGLDRSGILEHVLSVHGAPDGVDAGTLVDAALSDLVALGILSQR